MNKFMKPLRIVVLHAGTTIARDTAIAVLKEYYGENGQRTIYHLTGNLAPDAFDRAYRISANGLLIIENSPKTILEH